MSARKRTPVSSCRTAQCGVPPFNEAQADLSQMNGPRASAHGERTSAARSQMVLS